jgi:hypothetical protein
LIVVEALNALAVANRSVLCRDQRTDLVARSAVVPADAKRVGRA